MIRWKMVFIFKALTIGQGDTPMDVIPGRAASRAPIGKSPRPMVGALGIFAQQRLTSQPPWIESSELRLILNSHRPDKPHSTIRTAGLAFPAGTRRGNGPHYAASLVRHRTPLARSRSGGRRRQPRRIAAAILQWHDRLVHAEHGANGT